MKRPVNEDQENIYNYVNLTKMREQGKVPIVRGCKNAQCFCTGKCRDIIGFRELHPLEKLNSHPIKGGI
jgi:hypothetical protein